MDDKDVDALLRLVGLRTTSGDDQYDFPREELIQRLMNITLQCLGAIRVLSTEQEKDRVARDSCDIDGTMRDSGKNSLISRIVFSKAVKFMTEVIVTSQDIDQQDPIKDIVETFPWRESLHHENWFMLNWAIVSDAYMGQEEEDEVGQFSDVKNVIKYFPSTTLEIDKRGQHYMMYAVRTNSMDLLAYFIKQNRHCVKFVDGTGKLAIHYACAYSQTPNFLYAIVEAMPNVSIQTIMQTYKDDAGNLPIHLAVAGSCSLETLKEIMFSFPDAAKVTNSEGKLPLHIAACTTNLDKVKAVFSAFPNAVSAPDKNGWLPLHHAAFTCKSVQITEFLYEKFPDAMTKPHQSGRLPIHYAAVTCNSSKVMQYLLDVHPDGAKTFDVNRRLPLHNLIARCTFITPSRLRCLRLLLNVYPEGASMSGKDGRTPLDLARRGQLGHLVLRLLLLADPQQDPQALGEISYLASKGKYQDRFEEAKG